MAKANFYLKNTQSDVKPIDQVETLILLYFRYNGNRLQYSTGETILPKFWNNETQRVKKTFTGCFEINNLLDRIEQEVKKIYRDAITNNQQINNTYLIDTLHAKINPQTNSYNCRLDEKRKTSLPLRVCKPKYKHHHL